MCYDTYNGYTYHHDWWKDYITTTNADAHTYMNSESVDTNGKTSVDLNLDKNKMLRC